MKRTLTLSLSLALTAAAFAQCTTNVNPGSSVINVGSPINSAGLNQNFWVCGDVIGKAVSGNSNHIWVETGAIFIVNGVGNTVYNKGGMLAVTGNNNTVYTNDPTNVTIVPPSTGTVITPCGAVQFTYTGAPANGCTVTGIEETAGIDLSIHPNPTSDELVLRAGSARVQAVRILDAKGAEVLTRVDDNIETVHLGGLTPGLYMAVITTTQGTVTRRIAKL